MNNCPSGTVTDLIDCKRKLPNHFNGSQCSSLVSDID